MNNTHDFRAKPLKWAQVDAIANNFRRDTGFSVTPYFPIVDVVEKIIAYRFEEIDFEVCTDSEMDGAYGLTCPQGGFIRIREDVYSEACAGNGRARFTVAHELGHLLLHADPEKPLARASSTENLKPFQSAESQANRFASSLLVSEELITSNIPEEVAKVFGVSNETAFYRLKNLGRLSS